MRWGSEHLAYNADSKRGRYYYFPVEHMMVELRRLAVGYDENGRLWLLGIANFNSYIKCKNRNPSLETLPDLQPLTTPVGSLVYYWILFGYYWPPLENRVNMDICNNGPFVIASYSDLSTSKEDVVLALRLRSCGVPLIRKEVMRTFDVAGLMECGAVAHGCYLAALDNSGCCVGFYFGRSGECERWRVLVPVGWKMAGSSVLHPAVKMLTLEWRCVDYVAACPNAIWVGAVDC
ncbi:hypothetical protein Nepgr_013478 [Nepenthes gracilis]|uniref:SMAX1-like nucleotide binding domain-containing protein n=1 Tax=Nepenthes gracilis TaxID=150966 RepID=A0AAD3XNQ1_NEPGR|nr:hypothetical protein Nepgr_013478 [Nepenthes gracilis]